MRTTLIFPILISALLLGACSALKDAGCGLRSDDAERFLGGEAEYLDRKDPFLGLAQDELSDSRVAACAFKTKDGSRMMQRQDHYATETEAVAKYDEWREQITSTQQKGGPEDYWEVDRFATYGDGTVVHSYNADGEHVDVAGRVGTTAFLIRSLGAPNNKAFSYVELRAYAMAVGKGLAEKK